MTTSLARELEEFRVQDQLNILGVDDEERNNEANRSIEDDNQAINTLFHDLNLAEVKEQEEETWENSSKYEIKNNDKFLESLENIHTIPGIPIALFEEILLFVGENWFSVCLEAVSGWSKVINSERIWKQICKVTFIPPAYKYIKLLNNKPNKFGSWNMTGLRRPRVKLSGVYIHRHSYIRDRGPNSMWTINNDRYLQISHYRYILFISKGYLLYSSTPIEPNRMLPKLHQILLQLKNYPKILEKYQLPPELDYLGIDGKTKRIFIGNYKVIGKELTMITNLGEYSVKFTFEMDNLETITAISHQSLKHFNNNTIQTDIQDENDQLVIHHPMQTLYRFEREWTFSPLF